jgi:hypothetical protein
MVNFEGMAEKLGMVIALQGYTAVEIVVPGETFCIDAFAELAGQLHEIDYVEKVPDRAQAQTGGSQDFGRVSSAQSPKHKQARKFRTWRTNRTKTCHKRNPN